MYSYAYTYVLYESVSARSQTFTVSFSPLVTSLAAYDCMYFYAITTLSVRLSNTPIRCGKSAERRMQILRKMAYPTLYSTQNTNTNKNLYSAVIHLKN